MSEQQEPLNNEQNAAASQAPSPQQSVSNQSAQQTQPTVQQPEYGQVNTPNYGAMSSQYGSNYNPYLYGAPDPKQKAEGEGTQQNAQGSSNPFTAGQQTSAANQQTQYNPQMLNRVNYDDPNQNPFYGHWDPYAFVAIVLFILPLVSLIFGAMSIWRCKKFHMKGRVLAIIAVVFAAANIALSIWMMLHGIDANTLYQMTLQRMGGQTSGGSSVSA